MITTVSCPFIVGPAIQDPAQFYGRQAELQQLSTRVGGVSAQSISIVGQHRMGKSSLLWQVVNRANLPFTSPYRLFHTTHHYIVFYLDLNSQIGKSNTNLMEKLRHDLQQANLPTWDKSDNGDLSALSYAFDDIERDHSNIRLVLCLDEFEAINDHPAEFDGLLEALRAEAQLGRVALVTASRTSLRELCQQGRNDISKFYTIFTQCELGYFTLPEWHELVLTQLPQARPEDLAFIERCAHGHPYLTQLAATLLWQNPTSDYITLEQQCANLS